MNKIKKLYCYIECNIWTQVLIVVILVTFSILEIQAISNEIKTLSELNQSNDSQVIFNDSISPALVTPDDLEEWMTFSYINTVFKLPEDYLASTLGIVDSAYPKLSILRYVRTHHISSDQFISELKNALINYSN